jgi:hypothetical protein
VAHHPQLARQLVRLRPVLLLLLLLLPFPEQPIVQLMAADHYLWEQLQQQQQHCPWCQFLA